MVKMPTSSPLHDDGGDESGRSVGRSNGFVADPPQSPPASPPLLLRAVAPPSAHRASTLVTAAFRRLLAVLLVEPNITAVRNTWSCIRRSLFFLILNNGPKLCLACHLARRSLVFCWPARAL